MANKMLINAAHPEETRVVVLRGTRVEEFDFETAQRKQLRGNIYLAKVTRVEPSLQAAFVEYGGNRHGFLAFSEIHPDYYQIPVADRQALIDEEERAQRDLDAEADNQARRRAERGRPAHRRRERIASGPVDEGHAEDRDEDDAHAMAAGTELMVPPAADDSVVEPAQPEAAGEVTSEQALAITAAAEAPVDLARLQTSAEQESVPVAPNAPETTADLASAGESDDIASPAEAIAGGNITEVSSSDTNGEEELIESVGG